MIGQIQSCFLRNSPVREMVRPTDVWPNVICACPVAEAAARLSRRRCQSQSNMTHVRTKDDFAANANSGVRAFLRNRRG